MVSDFVFDILCQVFSLLQLLEQFVLDCYILVVRLSAKRGKNCLLLRPIIIMEVHKRPYSINYSAEYLNHMELLRTFSVLSESVALNTYVYIKYENKQLIAIKYKFKGHGCLQVLIFTVRKSVFKLC